MNHKGQVAFIAAGLGVLAIVPGRAAGPISVVPEGDRELARVVVDGRTVGVGTATNSGVWVRDVAVGAGLVPALGEYVRLTGQVTQAEEATTVQADAEALGLSVRSEYRSQEGGVGIDLTVTDRTGTERAVQVQLRIPLAADAGPWFWNHNVLSEQPLDAAPEHANYTMVDWGPRQAHTSAYPLACVRTDEVALALSVPLKPPLMFRLTAHHTAGGEAGSPLRDGEGEEGGTGRLRLGSVDFRQTRVVRLETPAGRRARLLEEAAEVCRLGLGSLHWASVRDAAPENAAAQSLHAAGLPAFWQTVQETLAAEKPEAGREVLTAAVPVLKAVWSHPADTTAVQEARELLGDLVDCLSRAEEGGRAGTRPAPTVEAAGGYEYEFAVPDLADPAPDCMAPPDWSVRWARPGVLAIRPPDAFQPNRLEDMVLVSRQEPARALGRLRVVAVPALQVAEGYFHRVAVAALEGPQRVAFRVQNAAPVPLTAQAELSCEALEPAAAEVSLPPGETRLELEVRVRPGQEPGERSGRLRLVSADGRETTVERKIQIGRGLVVGHEGGLGTAEVTAEGRSAHCRATRLAEGLRFDFLLPTAVLEGAARDTTRVELGVSPGDLYEDLSLVGLGPEGITYQSWWLYGTWMGEPGARLLEQQRQGDEVAVALLLPFGPNLNPPPPGAAWGFNYRVLAWGEEACWSPPPQFHRFQHAGVLIFP